MSHRCQRLRHHERDALYESRCRTHEESCWFPNRIQRRLYASISDPVSSSESWPYERKLSIRTLEGETHRVSFRTTTRKGSCLFVHDSGPDFEDKPLFERLQTKEGIVYFDRCPCRRAAISPSPSMFDSLVRPYHWLA